MESNFHFVYCVFCLFLNPPTPSSFSPRPIIKVSCGFLVNSTLTGSCLVVCAQFDAFLSFMSEFLKILLLTISFTHVLVY